MDATLAQQEVLPRLAHAVTAQGAARMLRRCRRTVSAHSRGKSVGHAVDFRVELAFADAVLAKDLLELGADEAEHAAHRNRKALFGGARWLLPRCREDLAIRATVEHVALEHLPDLGVALNDQTLLDPATCLAKRGANPRTLEVALGAAVARLDAAGGLLERLVAPRVQGSLAPEHADMRGDAVHEPAAQRKAAREPACEIVGFPKISCEKVVRDVVRFAERRDPRTAHVGDERDSAARHHVLARCSKTPVAETELRLKPGAVRGGEMVNGHGGNLA